MNLDLGALFVDGVVLTMEAGLGDSSLMPCRPRYTMTARAAADSARGTDFACHRKILLVVL